ncbi:MAG TPA: FHA domain-containing protein [Planctomycetota bacterium]|nr:FHA domain-containing protein [Planctomycetota bacterium]
MPKVLIKEGPDSGRVYEVAQAAILGRLDTSDIPVKDGKASREHAKIYKQGEQFAIVDLNSSNGTFVNGEKITKRILKNGDEISIGTVRLLFELAEAQEKKQPARKGLDDAFDAAKKDGDGTPAAAAAAAGGGAKAGEIVLKGHQPIQVHRIKPGSPLLGVDLDQLSDTGRILVWAGLIILFGGLMYLAYMLVAG